MLFRSLVLENRLLPPAVRDVWVSIQSAISFHFSLAAERERKLGRLVSLPPHMLFNTWIGLVHHYLVNGDLFAPEGDVLARHGDTLIESFMALIHR